MKQLYIRSQDTYRLIKFDRSLSISNNNSIMDGNGNMLGSYKNDLRCNQNTGRNSENINNSS